MRKKSKVSRKHSKVIRESVSEDLKGYDMQKWKSACKGFGPIHYVRATRKQWLDRNSFRVEGAREIVEFVDRWVAHFRYNEAFANYSVAATKQEVILVIRNAQLRIKTQKGILNSVKLNGFKTLIKWADNPKELRKGPQKNQSDTATKKTK